jgi:hypothetical protein
MQAEKPAVFATLARLAEEGMDADIVASNAASIWRNVELALAPIIGQSAVAALYKRSLHISRATSPFLTAVFDVPHAPGDYAPLQTALSQQSGADASAALSVLLQTFHELLVRLIGESLTERLLRTVWDNPSYGLALRDTSS